jgi:hypothetical protein
LREVILPSQGRKNLIEFLLETLEPGILGECGSIETALKQMGCWPDKRKFKLDELLGFFESLQLLWKLCRLVETSISTSKLDESCK